jgi:hypothetical protein
MALLATQLYPVGGQIGQYVHARLCKTLHRGLGVALHCLLWPRTWVKC